MTTIFFERPEALLLLAPAIIIILFFTFKNFIKFHDEFEKRTYLKKRQRKRVFAAILRVIIAAAIIIALAGPITVEEKHSQGDMRIKIFVDDSRSMEMYDRTVASKLRAELEKEFPVTVIGTAETDKSSIGDFLLRTIEQNDNILLISDGNANAGKSLDDVLLLAHKLNASVNTIKLAQIASDAWVNVQTPELSAAGTDTPVQITVKKIGSSGPIKLTVELDGQTWISQDVVFDSEDTYTLALSKTLTEGDHLLVATINSKDHFLENNAYRRVIKVETKPKVLFLTKSSGPPILSLLKKLFDVTSTDTLPADLSKYSTIIIDNMKASDLPSATRIADFITEGKGLILIGGPSALDRGDYKGAQFENLLPVSVGNPKKDKNQTPNIAIVIDISGSSGAQFSASSTALVEEVQKNIALGLLGDLKNETKVAIVAFNQNAYTIAPLAEKSKQPDLADKILSLSLFGGTLIDVGIREGLFALAKEPGSKTMILISDGQTPYQGDARKMAAAAAANNIKLFTVGVGQGTDEKFMKELAAIGKGSYFKPSESDRIQLVLGAAQKNENQNNTNALQIVDFNDFITKDLTLRGTVTGYNTVIPKSSGKVIVSLNDGHPILTTWRFGLGRVAVLSTDDGSGWASTLLGTENAALISKTVFWTVGDPRAAKDFDVLTTQGFAGEPLTVLIKDTQVPKEKGLTFSKIDEDLYTTTLTADQIGFVKVLNQTIAINYPRELSPLGINPKFNGLIQATGGAIFEETDTKAISEMVKRRSEITEVKSTSWSWLTLAIALTLIVIDIVGRKISESRASR